MERTRQNSNVAAHVGYEWNPDFATPQTQSRSEQNRPFWAQNDQEVDAPQETDEILSQFLGEIFDDAGPVLYQAVPIRQFCSPADFSILVAGNDTCLQKHMVLLDERNDDGVRQNPKGTCRRRYHDGALSTSGLFEALRKKRYNATFDFTVGTVAAVAAAGAAAPSAHIQRSAHKVDADRRLVYVTDIDKWCMLAIISTAPSFQAAFLRDFIYRYLELKTHVGVQVPTSGFQNFALEFHLPFYAYKKGSELVKDGRLKSNSKPLRRTGDLRFLELAPFPTESSGSDECIYEAQISVLVTGVDHWSWTAYAFVDTYYKGAGNQESVEHYINQVQLGARLDPLTEGQSEAEPPVWRPREYFLQVLEARVKQVNREWQNTVFRILQRIEPNTHDDLLSEPEHRQGPADDVLNKETQMFFDRTTRLLHQMSYQISLTVDACKRFIDVELAYFSNLENLPGRRRTPAMLISEITREVEDLQMLQKNLDHQRDLLQDLLQKLEKGLQMDSNAIANLQHENAVLITALTISASFLGIFSTTASIFSIDGVVATAGNVAGVVVSLLAGLLLIFSIVLKWPWYMRLVELSAGTTSSWKPLGDWTRFNLRQARKTVAANGSAVPQNIPMGRLGNSNNSNVV